MRPIKITLYIWITIALLGAICLMAPQGGWTLGAWKLRWPTLSEALDLSDTIAQSPITSSDASIVSTIEGDSLGITSPVASIQDSSRRNHVIANNEAANTLSPDSATLITSVADHDPHIFLAAFYAALDSADRMPVRVVHYGDSQIEEDRISSVLRELWQEEYGGGGVGLLPLHQTIPTGSLRQWLSMNGVTQTTQGGPKRYIIYGPSSMRLKGDDYGIMGQVARLNNSLISGSEHVVFNVAPYDKKIKCFNYFNRLRILADDVKVSISNPTTEYRDTIIHSSAIFTLPDSTMRCSVHFKGKGNVYGVSLETPTGVLVDNIPMRGCSGSIFTRIDSLSLSTFYRESNVRLIILQYGGNMIPQTKNQSTVRGYVDNLRKQVRFLRACAPQASILFIGPSDMSTRINGVMTTYPMVPYMDEQLALMAQEEGIAYWSMFEAMGGRGSMITWRNQGLAGNDYIHFTRKGARKVGRMLHDWFNCPPPSYIPTPSQISDSVMSVVTLPINDSVSSMTPLPISDTLSHIVNNQTPITDSVMSVNQPTITDTLNR